ncbi:hypothetical protein DICPUDRAFT_38706 [Dictyostelium purpureum]|uniref:Uncharacterized protein n=1 Tax=Dictyostelium purpureum TaxID=5786 RepID=F0ZV26_DICPU|nr:uncharacterized protein DICPUDRAFT_38706 [Dictyostelium purpureum]EGC32202.1 hypothetical protein DICPUDRAFT_38706 [Dictyostelium purpureum]|eukprot:XP_003291274.1 hypothetical protein DICPUDRAFT_38706 [Dictyostelium purpureum]
MRTTKTDISSPKINILIGVVGNTLVFHTGTSGSIPEWGAFFIENLSRDLCNVIM